MSKVYPTITAFVPPGIAPRSLASSEDGWELLSKCDRLLRECDSDLHPIGSQSWGGWTAMVMRNISAALGLRALQFLSYEPWKDPNGFCAFLIQGNDLPEIVREIDLVFKHAELRPGDFAPWMFDWDGDSITASIAASVVSVSPVVDDGTNPQSLFSYLKTLAHYCTVASERGGAILYLQWDS